MVKQFGEYTDFLTSTAADDLVILSDVGDVVFQDDPFPPLAELLGNSHDIVVQEEPHTFGEGIPCLIDNLRGSFPSLVNRLAREKIICAGIIAGRARAICELSNRIYQICTSGVICRWSVNSQVPGNDQDTLNVIARGLTGESPRIRILPPFAPWCYHAILELRHPALFAKLNPGANPSNQIGGYIRNGNTREIYPALHLYKYSAEWKRTIRERLLAPSETPLCRLAQKWRTDKTPAILHGYTPYYHSILGERSFVGSTLNSIRRVLEIGIGYPEDMWEVEGYETGASLRMWRDYFPEAEIIGIDCDQRAMVNEERIKSYCGDTTNEDSWRSVLPALGWAMMETGSGEWVLQQIHENAPLDLIIDDESHAGVHQVATAKHVVPLLAPDGIYVIEDVSEPEIVTAGLTELGYRYEVHDFGIDKRPDDRLIRVFPRKE